MGDEWEWPLRGWDAVAADVLSVRELRRFYIPVYPGVHIPRGAELSAAQRAKAAWLWSSCRGVIAGLSAAAVLGAKWIEPGLPAELIHTNRRPPPMLDVHTDAVTACEIQRVDGMVATTAARTAFDIARRLELVAGVARVDALMNATDVKVHDIGAVARGASRRPRFGAAAPHTRARRRRGGIALRIAHPNVVRASRIPATRNPDYRRRRIRHSRRRHRYGLARLPRRC